MSTLPTFVGAGTAVTGNNASLAPLSHASTATGDVVFIIASIRNNGVGVPATPTSWTRTTMFGASSNVQVFARVYDGAWTMPTVTFTGGVANADTLAQAITFRGLRIDVDVRNDTTNVSQQNITAPTTVLPTRNNEVALYVGWKKDDWTSVAWAGITEVAEIVSTAGDDAAMVSAYSIQTTATTTSTTGWTVTGGASAVGAAGVAVFSNVPSIAAVEQDVYPPRVAVSVSDLFPGDDVQVYRVVGGVRTLLRGGSATDVTDPSFVVIDAELPFGHAGFDGVPAAPMPVSYVAVINGTTEYSTSSTTYELPGRKVVLSDAITGQAAEVVIIAWPERRYDRQASTFKVGARNIVVSGPLGQFEGDFEVYAATTSAMENLMTLMATATSGIVQVRQLGGYDRVDSYVAILGVTEMRWSQDGTDPQRRVTLRAVETDPWATTLYSQGFTLQDIADAYTGQTLLDFSNDYATLLDVAVGDFS